MARCFVKETDRVIIEVYYAETEDGNIEAGSSPEELQSKNYQKINFTFRRPRHQDSVAILSGARVSETGLNDYIGLQNGVLKVLLVDWDLKDDDGKVIEFSKQAITSLDPVLSRAAAIGFLGKVSI